MKQNKKDYIVTFILAFLLLYLTYVFTISQISGIYNDFNGHLYVYLPLFSRNTLLEGWMTTPYCLWHMTVLLFNKLLHIPLEPSAAYATCAYALLSFVILYWMVIKITTATGKEESPTRASFISFGLCFVQSFHFYWLDAGDRFLGTFSMNPLHNPTQMCVRGLSLLAFCLVYDIWGRQISDGYCGVFFKVERGLVRYYIYLTIILFLTVLAKPTFAQIFIPAVAFIMLGRLIRLILQRESSLKKYFRHCLTTLLCAIPSLLYILLQYFAYYIWGRSYGENSSIIFTKAFEVWHLYSDNIILSIVLSMAFPLYMLMIDTRFFFKDRMGLLAIIGYAIGLLEAGFLGESGTKMSHGNFLWPMMSGMLLLWTASMMRLLVLERTAPETKQKRILLNIAWILFVGHLLCGFIFLTSPSAR